MDLLQLKQRESYLIGNLEFLRIDIREYINHPCETVSIDDLKYQYDFDIRQLKKVREDIQFLLIAQSNNRQQTEIQTLLTQPFI